MMFRQMAVLAAALMTGTLVTVAACAPKAVETEAATAVQTPTAADCAARGGTMQAVGRAQTMQCVVRYADAGKRCTTGSDCAGDCRVETTPFPEAGAAAVKGELPSPLNPPAGCAFASRCPHATDRCTAERPEWREVEGRLVACHFAGSV